eukprot:scaffold14669_cov72-Phaeocystis_antarctica.AAC.3
MDRSTAFCACVDATFALALLARAKGGDPACKEKERTRARGNGLHVLATRHVHRALQSAAVFSQTVCFRACVPLAPAPVRDDDRVVADDSRHDAVELLARHEPHVVAPAGAVPVRVSEAQVVVDRQHRALDSTRPRVPLHHERRDVEELGLCRIKRAYVVVVHQVAIEMRLGRVDSPFVHRVALHKAALIPVAHRPTIRLAIYGGGQIVHEDRLAHAAHMGSDRARQLAQCSLRSHANWARPVGASVKVQHPARNSRARRL